MSDLWHDLEAWEPTDIHITPVYDGEGGWLDHYAVAVVLAGQRHPVEAQADTVDEALGSILWRLDREG